MPFVNANKINIYYEVYGEGAPLILITGFTQHHLAWKGCIPELSRHFQVIALDNRGAGQTDATKEGYSIELFAQDTVALMDELQIESAHFMGQSMGTLIIQQLCIAYPNRVKKSVLCGPFTKLPAIAKHNIRSQLKMLRQGVDRALLIELNAAWLLSNDFLEKPENIAQFVKESLSNPHPQEI